MRKKIQHIAALACMAMSLACCTKPNWTSGNAVRFGAGTKGGNLTKTSYGEIVDGSPRKQMIDWQAGDMIRIACAQASTAEGAPVIADYVTTDGIRYGTSAESRATLSLAGHNDKGLRWGSETQAHVFYAVYPSPHIKSGDKLADDGSGILTGTIPEDQPAGTISAGTETGSYVAACDMKNQYLVARKTVAAGKQSFGEEEVYLYFTPVTTAIEFEVKNVTGAALDIRNIEILSANHNLSGTFTADLEELSDNGGVYPAVTVASGNRKTAHVSFGDGYALAENNTLTFTVFLFPESDKESTAELNEAVLDDLTFRINKTDNTWIQTALKSDASTWITFDRCKKHFVKGLLAQE